MRIFLACQQARRRHPVPAYDFWAYYFKNGLSEAGHSWCEAEDVDWAEGLTPLSATERRNWLARSWESTLTVIRREHARHPINLFIGYLYPGQVELGAVYEILGLGIPVVNFFCDNVREFRHVPPEYRAFSLHWVPEFAALPMYQQAGLPCLYAPMPVWIPISLRRSSWQESEPVTFVGSEDLLRRDLLARALAKGADLIIRGAGWISDGRDKPAANPGDTGVGGRLHNQIEFVQRHGLRGWLFKLEQRLFPLHPPAIPPSRIRPAVCGEEYFRVTQEAQITIGVNRVPTFKRSLHRPLSYSRLRDIEAPMLGACYLTEWAPGLAQLYEFGREIEVYRDAEELADKIKMLARDATRRHVLRAAGQRRALSDHCIARTLERIAERLGF
jgi:hypothetical protein